MRNSLESLFRDHFNWIFRLVFKEGFHCIKNEKQPQYRVLHSRNIYIYMCVCVCVCACVCKRAHSCVHVSLFLFVVPSKKVRVMKNCTVLPFIYLRIHKQLILSKVRIIQNCNASPFKYLKMNKQLWLSKKRIVKNCNASGSMYTRMKKPLLLSKELWRTAVFKYVRMIKRLLLPK